MCTFLKPKSSKEWPPLLHRLHMYYLRLSCKTPRKPFKSRLPKLSFQLPRRLCAVVAQVSTAEPSSEAARRLYVGNIPRNVTTDELRKIVEDHGAVEKAEVMYDENSGRSRRFAFVTMKSAEDANATIEKLHETEIGGRTIKVNITEKPLASSDASFLQVEDSKFIDCPYKVYSLCGQSCKECNYRNTERLFLRKGESSQCKGISILPRTSKSSGYGFVTFSSEEDVETAIFVQNNAVLEGPKIRANKA